MCTEELSKLNELDASVYPNGIPFKASKASEWNGNDSDWLIHSGWTKI